MNEKLVGNWVEIELVSGDKWIGKVEEWDEDAIFISNGIAFGEEGHKGAECTNQEAAKVNTTDLREFTLKQI
jgi:hypothetical protein